MRIQKFNEFNDNNSKLKNTIIKLKKEYLEDGISSEEINNGYCADFANSVYSYHKDVEILSEYNFIHNIELNDNVEFSKNLDINKYGLFYVDKNKTICEKYNSYPKYDYVSIKFLPIHTWVYYNGKHYDSDEPDGVYNFFDLPTFKNFKHYFG